MSLGVLLRPAAAPPPPPETLPIGRAALFLLERGVTVVFGGHAEAGRLHGHRPVPGGWEAIALPVHAAFDRYGSFTDPTGYARLLEGLGGAPVRNTPALTALFRDKVATQSALGHLGMPALTVDPRTFRSFLADGPAFVKPRFGSFGRGVARVVEAPPARAVVDGVDQPLLLQRAVPPPPGWAGVSLRILAQRTPGGIVTRTPVARLSTTDPVVNRARGAEVRPVSDVFPGSEEAARNLARRVLEAFPEAVEVGVDAVLDPSGEPHLIEVNARPRGRLAALAERWPDRFAEEHEEAVRTPLLATIAASDLRQDFPLDIATPLH